ncbi:MAG: hypothetical protein DBY24_11825 [Prevotellaceae bacterium]|nr:MAG: hypothetical protein DBY24_11825 [Prevotellaceae bacterium]
MENKRIESFMDSSIGGSEPIKKKEYELMEKRVAELKESVRSLFLEECYEEFDELMESIELLHEMDIKAVYQKGLQQGAYFQKAICGQADID